MPHLPPAFEQNGVLAAASSRNLNDGAAALVLVYGDALQEYNLQPLAKIVSHADVAQTPEWDTT